MLGVAAGGMVYESRIVKYPKTQNPTTIRRSSTAVPLIRELYNDYDIEVQEVFMALYLNSNNNVTGFSIISQGTVNSTLVDTKILAKGVIDNLATGCIVTHNHPSGNIKPSSQDLAITKQIKEVLNLFSVELLDSIIITKDSYFSFTDEGVL